MKDFVTRFKLIHPTSDEKPYVIVDRRTGRQWDLGRHGIECSIDEAKARYEDLVRKDFYDWVREDDTTR